MYPFAIEIPIITGVAIKIREPSLAKEPQTVYFETCPYSNEGWRERHKGKFHHIHQGMLQINQIVSGLSYQVVR